MLPDILRGRQQQRQLEHASERILTQRNNGNSVFSKLRCLDDFFKRIALVRINSSAHGWFPWLCYLLSTPALGLPTHH